MTQESTEVRREAIRRAWGHERDAVNAIIPDFWDSLPDDVQQMCVEAALLEMGYRVTS